MGEDLQEKARHEAVLLTATWYFEGTVLVACVVMFTVLALQSKTVPPSGEPEASPYIVYTCRRLIDLERLIAGDLAVVLSMGEVFVTLFLTVDVLIQVVVCMTHAERAKILRCVFNIFLIFFLYIFYIKMMIFLSQMTILCY